MKDRSRIFNGIDLTNKNNWFVLLVILSIIEGIIAFVWTISLAGGSKNELLLGLSYKRIILLGVIAAGLIGLISILSVFFRNPRFRNLILRISELPKIAALTGFIGGLFLLVSFIPTSNYGIHSAFADRILPLWAWIGLILLEWFFFTRIENIKRRITRDSREDQRYLVLWVIGILIFSMLILIITVAPKIYSKNVNEDYWFESGVPILFWQVIICVFLGLLVNKYKERIYSMFGKRTNLLLFGIIFLTFAIIWGLTPLKAGSLETGPFPPNYAIYPRLDAADYDLQGQTALLGLGFNNSNPLDRPFYPFFLALLRLFAGQDFINAVTLQAIVFAFFPAIVFLTCLEFTSPGASLASALAVGFWGANSIAANSFLSIANPKQMLTDFFLAVILSLLMLFLVKWFNKDHHNHNFAVAIGCLLGLAAYVRYSALLLIPVVFVLVLLKYRKNLKSGFISLGFISLAFIVFILPWYSRNIIVGKRITIPFSSKILFVIHQRIDVTTNTSVGQFREETSQENSSTANATAGKNDLSKPFPEWFSGHLEHNLLASLLILPSSTDPSSLISTLSNGQPIWVTEWDGKLPAGRVVFLLIQFAFLSIGCVKIFKKHKWVALSVIFVFFAVTLANTMGRTSGGRYIAPVAWLILPVYFVGLFSLWNPVRDITNQDKPPTSAPKNKLKIITLFMIVLIGGAAPIIFERSLASNKDRLMNMPELDQVMKNSGKMLSPNEIMSIESAILDKNQKELKGFAFYPIQQRIDRMDFVPEVLTKIPMSNSLTFYLVRGKRYDVVYFPFDAEIQITNMDLVFAYGCKISGSYVVNNLIIWRDGTELSAYHNDLALCH